MSVSSNGTRSVLNDTDAGLLGVTRNTAVQVIFLAMEDTPKIIDMVL